MKKVALNILLVSTLISSVILLLSFSIKSKTSTEIIKGYRQELNADKKNTGKAYLFSIEEKQNGKTKKRVLFSPEGDTLHEWEYDDQGRLLIETEAGLHTLYLYSGDSMRKHSSSVSYLMNGKDSLFSSANRIDSCTLTLPVFRGKTGIVQTCAESCIDRSGKVDGKIIYSYDAQFHICGKGNYTSDGELKKYYNTDYDKKGNIIRTTSWSFGDQWEERLDYIYDKKGHLKKANGYYNNNAKTTSEIRFTVIYSVK